MVAGAISDELETILRGYVDARGTQPFGGEHEMRTTFRRLEAALRSQPTVAERGTIKVQASLGRGNWAAVPWVALMDERETTTTRQGVYCVYLFREDMSGVYLTLNQGVTEPTQRLGLRQGRMDLRKHVQTIRELCVPLLESGFALDDGIDLRAPGGLGANYEVSTIAYKLYERERLPGDRELLDDLRALLDAYEHYVTETEVADPPRDDALRPHEQTTDVQFVYEALRRRQFVFEPWQVAAYVAAIRTKPFVILAGISGTGKSKLPALVATITGGRSVLVPVRPDWTDSSEVLGYSDLQGDFRPGAVLEVARDAVRDPRQEWFCILDEMNLARVELYFAEVLSRIEDRHPAPGGGYASAPLLAQGAAARDGEWNDVPLPANLAIVGTVNMDESSHGFSRKVLDRAFTLEFSDVNLGA